MYGGTPDTDLREELERGLSPRVRGNHAHGVRIAAALGSIPACTGEPAQQKVSRISVLVYPRVYGGTRMTFCRRSPTIGLSPRVRGNPPRLATGYCQVRSIPACTGEPRRRPGPRLLLRVYPRVYGGTPLLYDMSTIRRGLSPRVRGNHHADALRHLIERSIPACTGEPCCRVPRTRRLTVYPRVYGGTRSIRG